MIETTLCLFFDLGVGILITVAIIASCCLIAKTLVKLFGIKN